MEALYQARTPEIAVLRLISQDEVISSLYETKDLHRPNELPYESATISFEQQLTENLRPTQLYAIGENVETQRQIRDFLLDNFGEDTLGMRYGGIEIAINNTIEMLLPPIIEESNQCDKPLVLDGTHRTLLATSIGQTAVGYICVRNIDSEFDIAHRRLPNEWEEITTFPTHESYLNARANGFIHRREGPGNDKSYRDFSHLIGKQRCGRA